MPRLLLLAALATVVTGLALIAAGLSVQPVIPEGTALAALLLTPLALLWAAVTATQALTARRPYAPRATK